MVTSLVFLLPSNVQGKMMKIANIGEENLHIFWATWAISMKFSGKMWTLIILKVTKKPALHDISRQHSIIKTTGEEGVEQRYKKFLQAWFWICKKGCYYDMRLYILNYILTHSFNMQKQSPKVFSCGGGFSGDMLQIFGGVCRWVKFQ